MERKLIGIFIVTLLITSGLAGASIAKVKNEKNKKVVVSPVNYKNLNENILQGGGWVRIKTYNNYASNGMPDFDQRQDSWQKIDAGPNQQIDSTASGDDIVVGNACIAPGNNAKLESSASGDDVVKWYYCGPTATANALWYIDSKHEKNDYPDNNQDTCNLVTKYAGISDDHATGNVPKLIEDLAVNFLGTSGKCTTTPKDVAVGAWNFINNSNLMGQYKVTLNEAENISMDNLSSWMQFSDAIILRLDTPGGGHFVTLQAVNSVANKIIISNPVYDGSSQSGDHTQHNNASIVSHDTYSVNPQTLQVINYPEGFTTITHAVNIWLLPKLKCIFVYPHRTVDMGDNYSELVQIINVEETTDDCLVYYYLPDGTIYTGGATVNGIPTEPLIDGNILKWSLPGMYPGQLYEIEFQVGATNPQQIELERRVRAWAYSTPINTELYADDFGILEINDDIPPTIGSVSHQIEGDTLSIYAQVTDNMKVDQVKVYITKPNQQTVNYNMVKSTGDLYKLILDISTWESGEYKYYIWAKDLAGNENESQEYTFLIVENLTADANGPYESIVGETIQFYGSAIAGASPYSWYWEFGDDSTSIEQNPTHVYVAPGNYTVTLTVTDNNDDTAIDTTWALIEENTPPNTPIIDGTTNGKAGNEYEYRFSSSDPEGHHISYYVDWGDGNDSGWIGPYASGEEVARSHIWQNRGGYIIRVKARDTLGEESDWATLEVSMPKNKAINPFLPFLERLIEQFPILEQILQLIYVYLG